MVFVTPGAIWIHRLRTFGKGEGGGFDRLGNEGADGSPWIGEKSDFYPVIHVVVMLLPSWGPKDNTQNLGSSGQERHSPQRRIHKGKKEQNGKMQGPCVIGRAKSVSTVYSPFRVGWLDGSLTHLRRSLTTYRLLPPV
jgi:hypothetical protein